MEVFAARLLPALARRGHAITVVAGHHRAGLPAATEVDGVRVHRFPFHQCLAARDVEGMAALLGAVARLKRTAAPDVVHLNTLGPSVLCHLRSARAWPAPVLLTLHSPVSAEAARLDTLYGRTLRSAAWLNANSIAVREALCRLVPELADRTSVTYYGMDAPALPPAPRPRVPPVLLAYGRLVVEKGFDLAVRALTEVRRQVGDARLVVVGDGPARPDLERLAVAEGLASAIEFRGPLPPADIPALLNTASLVVVPSRWEEPFGLVALEAALMARPVVAARVGGLAEVVEDGRTGVLVEREDWRALAAAIVRLLQEPARADAMGLAARQRAGRRFAWQRCVAEYERLYEKVAAATGGGWHE